MALNDNQLLALVGSTLDVAQATVGTRAMAVFQDSNTKYKVVVELSAAEDKLTVTRRSIN